MFHVASAALNMPAFSPTRGSGLGATVDMLYFGPPAQAARKKAVSEAARNVETLGMSDSYEGTERGIIARAPETGARRASSACGRFQWFDRRTRPRRSDTRLRLLPLPGRTAHSPS